MDCGLKEPIPPPRPCRGSSSPHTAVQAPLMDARKNAHNGVLNEMYEFRLPTTGLTKADLQRNDEDQSLYNKPRPTGAQEVPARPSRLDRPSP